MTPARWLVLALLVASMALVQRLGLEAQPETKVEAPFKVMPELKASDALPTYISSLFLGAFRAVAIDVLWIRLKGVEADRRWYELRENLQLIATLQPRNPEVWAHLAWHCCYNVCNAFSDEKSKRWAPDSRAWDWYSFGLKWLRKGIRRIPESVYLKFELGRTLHHKPSWRVGRLEYDFLRAIEEDAGVQEALRDEPYRPPGLSSFQLAIPWLERARDQVLARPERHQLTQAGLYIYASSMDGFIRDCLYHEGIYRWHRRDAAGAKAAFLRAAEHTERMIRKDYPEPLSPLQQEFIPFFRGLPALVDLDARAQESGKAEDLDSYREALVRLLVSGEPLTQPLDDAYLWGGQNPETPANRLKYLASGSKDRQECNDAPKMAFPTPPRILLEANLEPAGDVDVYRVDVLDPDDGHGHAPEGPPGPVRVTLHFDRPAGAGMDLKVTVLDPLLRTVKEAEAKGKAAIEFTTLDRGHFSVKVEALGSPSPRPASDYRFRWEPAH